MTLLVVIGVTLFRPDKVHVSTPMNLFRNYMNSVVLEGVDMHLITILAFSIFTNSKTD